MQKLLSLCLCLIVGRVLLAQTPVTFTVDAGSVPVLTNVAFTTITGTYTTVNGSGTWSFTKTDPNCGTSCNNSKFHHTSSSSAVSVNTSNQRVYFGFNASLPHTTQGTFTFTGPAIQPIITGISGAIYSPSFSSVANKPLDYGVQFDNWTCTWSGGGTGLMHDPNNQTTRADGASFSSGSSFDITGIPNNDDLTWTMTLPNLNTFDIYTESGAAYEGFGLMAISYVDTDEDGVPDVTDIDDDNDGIPDELEYGNCASGIDKDMIVEDFGTGPRTSTPYTNYCYEDGTGNNACTAFPGNKNCNDGEYTIVQNPRPDAAGFSGWTTQGDHTGNSGGRMMVVNASVAADEFYRRTIDVVPNVNVTMDLWILNVIIPGNNIKLPNVSLSIETLSGTQIGSSVVSGSVPENGLWNNYTLALNPGNNSKVQIVLTNVGPGGQGNDLALDDINVKQIMCDSDGDGIADAEDLDSDNDGIPDIVEAGGVDTDGDGRVDNFVDTDGDGLSDEYDDDNGGTAIPYGDKDGDGIVDALDLDADNDGIPDVAEVGGTDSDGDGRADNYVDSDGDGYNDVVDGDVGNDGTAENSGDAQLLTGADTNGDGRPDSYPNDDKDGDGILNHLDLDSDNDGIPDVIEAGGTDFQGDGYADDYVDADGDGFNDVLDGDVGNDGVAENPNPLFPTGTDTNGDGEPNSYPEQDQDGDGYPNFWDIDADNDGILDVIEAGGDDFDNDGQADDGAGVFVDADGDGYSDNYDSDVGNDGTAEAVSNTLITTWGDLTGDGRPFGIFKGDVDNDGLTNHLDRDADNDGIVDAQESQGNSCFISPDGTTVDANGVPTNMVSYTNCGQTGLGSAVGNSSDYNNTTYGVQVTADNDDGNNTADYLDTNADGDAYPDWMEGFDRLGGMGNKDQSALDYYLNIANFYELSNGNPGHYVNSADDDGDGLPNWLDNLVTASSGDPKHNANQPPFQIPGNSFYRDSDNDGIVDLLDVDQGGFAQDNIRRSDFDGDGDYDWRDADNAVGLPIELINFEASPLKDAVLVKWTVATELNNSHFILQRSKDGVIFEDIAHIEGRGTAYDWHEYQYEDLEFFSGANYYQLIQVDYTGERTNCGLTVVNMEAKGEIIVWPNPTTDQLYLSLPLIEDNIIVSLYNQQGQRLNQRIIQREGRRSAEVWNVDELPRGTYYFIIQSKIGEERIKIVLK